jgi:hypothetical protein
VTNDIGAKVERYESMTDPLESVVVPYSRFLEFQDRRHHVAAAEPAPTDHPPTSDAVALPATVAIAPPQPLTANES